MDRNANGVVDITGTASTSDILQENHYYGFGLGFEGPWLQNDAGVRDNKYTYNGKEMNDDFGLNWSNYGARWYDATIGRWNGVDPLAEKMQGWTPYNYTFDNPMRFVDSDGKAPIEPARNQAGTIQQAVNQWKAQCITTLAGIQGIIRNKDIEGTGEAGVRYIYTKNRGWVDLSHYALVQEKGEFLSNQLEWVGGLWIPQIVLGPEANESTYSYEDLPSNQFSSEINLSDLEGNDLFEAIINHFTEAGATSPEKAPNYRQIPYDDKDRKRLPAKLIYSASGIQGLVPDFEKLKTGKYIPQNRSNRPYPLNNFDPASTNLEQ